MTIRGISLSHQTVHDWTQIFGTELDLKLCVNRKGTASKKWHI